MIFNLVLKLYIIELLSRFVQCSQEADVFSSVTELAKLVNKEREFIQELENLAEQFEKSAKSIRKYLKFNKHRVEASSEEQYVGNPINSLSLINRLSVELDTYNVSSALKDNTTDILLDKLRNMTKEFPEQKDLIGASNGIHLLQEHYRLNISLLCKGVIEFENQVFPSEHDLTPDEITMIGISANNDGFHDSGVEWLNAAKQKYLTLKGSDRLFSDDVRRIDKLVVHAKQIHDHILDHRGQFSGEHRCNSLPFDAKLRKKKKYREARRTNSSVRVEKPRKLIPLYSLENIGETSLRENFEQVCKGEVLRTPDMDANKQCRLLHHRNPYLLLGPFKLEELSFAPYITVIHELMFDSEMEYFKNLASGQLERSGHGSGSGSTTSLKRTSKQTWLDHRIFNPNQTEIHLKMGGSTVNDSLRMVYTDPGWTSYYSTRETMEPADPVASKVSDRMELATRFTLYKYSSAEPFQIANYGLGGQYSQHMDPHGYWDGVTNIDPQAIMRGDRMATIMVYLADVEAGGATSFPSTGIRLKARKGDAAFWINLRTSGIGDKLTHHGGCPVLVGSKWITNKWVGYSDQFRHYPCDREGYEARFKRFTAYYQ